MDRSQYMKQLKMAAVLLMTAVTPIWAQAPTDHDSHHPAESAAPAPAPAQTSPQAAQPSRAPGMTAPMMMEMMGRNMPIMNMMRMMTGMPGAGMGGMATIDRVEGRIAFLRTELKITDAQTNAFNTFTDALRANARRLGELRPSMMMGQPQAPTLADRLDLQERWLTARLEGTRALKSAFVILSGVLSDEQKQTANELLAPHMGMMTMMYGMMASRQPGQAMPGPMMRQPAPQPGN
jgi:hypothetical protein